MKWGWLFRTYVQWHAIAFLLSELCTRTKGEAVERAWRALEATAGRWWFPLNDTSPYGKGQQGCLWKPLKKLLAKARAARERELTLERASLALRSQHSFGGNAPMSFPPPIGATQPSSETLDRMLRPTAPRLGESPIASRSSWPSSPTVKQFQDMQSNGFVNGGSPTQQNHVKHNGVMNGGAPTQQSGDNHNGVRQNRRSPGQEFDDLTNFGLDSVINDVMGNTDYEGNAHYDFNGLDTTANPMSMQSQPQPMQMSNPTTNGSTFDTATSINRAHGTFGDAQFFSNMNFNTDIAPDANGQGQLTESPNLDGGVMDWTQWDDLVNQYGSVEGFAPNGNPASQGGLVHWF